jgi:hypothetical protein
MLVVNGLLARNLEYVGYRQYSLDRKIIAGSSNRFNIYTCNILTINCQIYLLTTDAMIIQCNMF